MGHEMANEQPVAFDRCTRLLFGMHIDAGAQEAMQTGLFRRGQAGDNVSATRCVVIWSRDEFVGEKPPSKRVGHHNTGSAPEA